MADDPSTQLVEHVTADDEVIEVVSRAEMRRRCVYVIVRTTDDRVVVHRRAGWKDVYPGWWDLCFGGVVDAGEDWEAAAARELTEEAGIEAAVTQVGGGAVDAEGAAVVGRIYEAVHDGPYPCPDGEVVEVRTLPRQELAAFVAGHDVCPDTVALVLPHLTGS